MLIPEGAWPTAAFVMTLRIARAVGGSDSSGAKPLSSSATAAWVLAAADGLARAIYCTATGHAGRRLLLSRPRTIAGSVRVAADDNSAIELRVIVNVTATISLRPSPDVNMTVPNSTAAYMVLGEVRCYARSSVLLVQPDASDDDIVGAEATLARNSSCETGDPLQLLHESVAVWPALWPLPSEWRAVQRFQGASGSAAFSPYVNCSYAEPGCQSLTAELSSADNTGQPSVAVAPSSTRAVVLFGRTVLLPLLPHFNHTGAHGLNAWLSSRMYPAGRIELPVATGIGAAAGRLALLTPALESACPDNTSSAMASLAILAALRRSRQPCPRFILQLTATLQDDERSMLAPPLLSICSSAEALASSSAEPTGAILVRPRAASIACPPLCSADDIPSAVTSMAALNTDSAAPPAIASDPADSVAEDVDGFSLLASMATAGGFGAAAAAVSTSPSRALQGGFRYVRPCQQDYVVASSRLLNIAAEICANESHPLWPASAAVCPWGEADDCVPCPQGGVCPGGYRLWSARGWWVRSEDSLLLPVRCPYPADLRCVGWDAASGRTACGPGYLPGMYACARCAEGYYADASAGGACSRCPPENARAVRAAVLAACVVIGCALAVVLALSAVAIAIAWRVGSTSLGAIKRTVGFTVVAVMALQAASSAASAAPPDSHPLQARVFAALRTLQLQGVAPLPLGCTDASPYAAPTALLYCALALMLLWLFTWLRWWFSLVTHASSGIRTALVWPRCQATIARACSCLRLSGAPATGKSWLDLVGWTALTTMSLFYSLVADTAADLLTCQPRLVTIADYQLMPGADGTVGARALVAAGVGTLAAVDVMKTTDPALLSFSFEVGVLPSFSGRVCMDGEHASARALALATVVLFTLGLPIISLPLARAGVAMILRNARVPAALLTMGAPHVMYGGCDTDAVLAAARGAQAGSSCILRVSNGRTVKFARKSEPHIRPPDHAGASGSCVIKCQRRQGGAAR